MTRSETAERMAELEARVAALERLVGAGAGGSPRVPQTSRRRLFSLGLGAAAATAVAVAAAPKPAQAQFGGLFGGGGGIAGLAGLIRLITRALTSIGVTIPPVFRRIINQTLGQIGRAGPHSLIIPSNVLQAMALSWPDAAVFPSRERDLQTLITTEATRLRVEEASALAAETAFTQGEQVAADEALFAAGEAAAALNSLLGVMQVNNALTLSNTNATRQLIMLQAGQTSVQGDGVIREQNARALEIQARRSDRDGLMPIPGANFLSR